VIGISVDEPSLNRSWAESLKLPFRLLSDLGPKGNVGRLYGVWDENWELERRVTFIIDRRGIIRKVLASQLALDDAPVREALRQLTQSQKSPAR
jgi:peroxiredoxin